MTALSGVRFRDLPLSSEQIILDVMAENVGQTG
jgi:hypothetical protein